MTSSEIRQQFLDFFRRKEHLIVPSAPLVAKDDPTLMFTNSGMAQFKDFFLGNGSPPCKRIADTQKCLRVSGKHNDLEDVGFDTYHHTLFEMLGNWSFGDYFKKEAIEWAWELLTAVYQLPKNRLYVSVFQGDNRDNVPFDQEAWDLWKPIVGEDRIILGNKKDNFWEMGDTGPCGPCSEIHIDLRPAHEIAIQPGKELVNADHPQVVEIWNLVFMQFNRKADGSLEPLPARHVDTGMGFERLCMAIQGKLSNYDTDVFTTTIAVIENLSGNLYGQHAKADIAMRVIADHIRAVSFAIADGLIPSNTRAGYVIRRILRRAVRYGYSYLGFNEPFLAKLVSTLADQFKDVFPELKGQQEFIARVIQEEEIAFLRTLENGLKLLDRITAELIQKGEKTINGEIVFELNDTFGFPIDLTALIAREKGLSIDEVGYQAALEQQKERSRKDAVSTASDWIELHVAERIEFVGYDEVEANAQLVKYRKVHTKQGAYYQIVLDRTPFYAESGGQVGDTGVLEVNANGNYTLITIIDTRKENDLIIHIAEDNNFEDLLNQHTSVRARIDTNRRNSIKNNHSTTHLLHAALRQVLGNHVSQKGSLVNSNSLRFDFSHFTRVTESELSEIENIVNEKIRKNIILDEKRNVPIEQAKAMGAMALFGEKYGDFVRVITFDPAFSVELCGGTHVSATGQIGLMKLVSEGSVSTGVRRLEAVTAEKALHLLNEQEATINQLKELLKAPKDLYKAVQLLLEDRNQLQKKIEALENDKLQQLKSDLLTKIDNSTGHSTLVEQVNLPSVDALKHLAYELKAKVNNLCLVLGADINGKPQLAVMLSDELIESKKLHAGNLVKELAKEIKGGGGGQSFFATAGGSDRDGLERALAKGRALLQ